MGAMTGGAAGEMAGPLIEFTLCISNSDEDTVYLADGFAPGHLDYEEEPPESKRAAHARFTAKRLRWLADRLEDQASRIESGGGN